MRTDLPTRGELLHFGRQTLNGYTESAYHDTLTLLSHCLQISITHLLASSDTNVSAHHYHHFHELLKKRIQGEPIAYLVGYCEFWSLPFAINSSCLIPRADTETMVEAILAYYPIGKKLRVLELGTGSGILAITLKRERPCWDITATDISKTSLELACYNAKNLAVSITFKKGDWFDALPAHEPFDIILSNPPYLSDADQHLGPLSYEPQHALIGGLQGTEILTDLIEKAPTYLTNTGRLWLEHGFDQAAYVQSCFQRLSYTAIQQDKDLNQIVRITSGSIGSLP